MSTSSVVKETVGGASAAAPAAASSSQSSHHSSPSSGSAPARKSSSEGAQAGEKGEMKKLPLSGLVAIVKPSGRTCMSLLDTLKPLLAQSKYFQVPADDKLQEKNPQYKKRATKRRRDHNQFTEASGGFMAPKIGQGGTLDPLAEGVLILGIGAGTKKLQQFLDCRKEYKTVALLGSSTLSYDACEPILLRRPFKHVNADTIREALPSFRGRFKQLPPLFSAIRIDGKRLFDYAREGIDLPRPIEERNVEVTQLELIDWKDGRDQILYKEPEQECSDEERKVALRARKLAGLDIDNTNLSAENPPKEDAKESTQTKLSETEAKEEYVNPPTFTLQMTVSSGTYVRSIVHDVGAKVDSAAHVVRLSRTRQGDWVSSEYAMKPDDDETKLRKAIDWGVIEKAAAKLEQEVTSSYKRQKTTTTTSGDGDRTDDNSQHEEKESVEKSSDDNDGSPAEWEQYLLDHMQIIET